MGYFVNKELTGKADLDLGSRSTRACASMACLTVLNGTCGSEAI